MELHFSYDDEEQVYVVSIQHYPVSGSGITLSNSIADFKERYADYVYKKSKVVS